MKKVLASYKYPKTDVYKSVGIGVPTMFSTTEESLSKSRRHQFGPAFSQTGLNTVEDLILKNGAISLIEKIGKEIDLHNGEYEMNYFHSLQNATLDIIGTLAFGKSFDAVAKDGHPITGWIKSAMFDTALKQGVPLFRVFPSLMGKYNRDTNKLLDFAIESIRQRKALIQSNKYNSERVDILQTIVDAVNPDDTNLTETQMAAEEVVMIIAGTDTTSVTMSWLLHLYTLYPNVYKKVVTEIVENFPDKTRPIGYREVREKLPYFVATINETMRLSPSVNTVLPRFSSSNGIQLSTHYIPKDVRMMMFIEGAGHDESVWESPKKFLPERFLGKDSDLTKEILPFSSGVRVCPGKNLAWMELLTIMPNLIRNFDFKLPQGFEFGPDILDPERDNEPKMIQSTAYLTRTPVNPDSDFRIIVTRRKE